MQGLREERRAPADRPVKTAKRQGWQTGARGPHAGGAAADTGKDYLVHFSWRPCPRLYPWGSVKHRPSGAEQPAWLQRSGAGFPCLPFRGGCTGP